MTMHIIIIQKDNNDSEAMERHHHDMELLCACLLKPRTEILKKKLTGADETSNCHFPCNGDKTHHFGMANGRASTPMFYVVAPMA